MKSIAWVSIILAIICVVSLGIAVALGPVMLFKGFETQSVNQFEEFSSSGIDELKINLLDTELESYPIEGNDFEFSLTGTYAKNEYNNSVELSVEKINGVLDVKVEYPEWLVLINRDLNLDVGVPKNYYGKLDVKTASGDVNVKNLKTKEIKIVSLSGEIEIYNIENSGEAFIKTTSGNIKIDEFESQNSRVGSVSGEIDCEDIKSSERFIADATSGSVNVANLDTDYSEFKTVSGEIYIDNSKKINSAITTSGDVNIQNLEIDNELRIRTLSGEVNLDFVDNSEVNLDFDSVSGDLDNSFGNLIGGENQVYVKTTSGDLSVY